MNMTPRANRFRIRPDSPLVVAAKSPTSATPAPVPPESLSAAVSQSIDTELSSLANQPLPTAKPRAARKVEPLPEVRAKIEPAERPFVQQPTADPAMHAPPAGEGHAEAIPMPEAIRTSKPSRTAADTLFAPAEDDGFGDGPFPSSSAHDGNSQRASNGSVAGMINANLTTAREMSEEAEADAIRRESLTGRQLRTARRIAQKHGLPATSDFDAVRLLRRAGIDPFQRTGILDLVQGEDAKGTALQISPLTKPNTLPQTVRQAPLPSPEVRAPEPPRVRDIMEIQADLAKRRRRKSILLMARLAFFVGLPTFLCAVYFYTIATPLYSTKSDFVIQKADSPASAAMGGLLSGTAFATATDSITVQGYLQSRDAMLRLDEDLGFKAHFSQPGVDALTRLEPDATNEAAYRLYKRNVKIGFDPTEGVIRMEVTALDPKVSENFSKALIKYAEQQVDQLTQRVREDQMKGARESYQDAEGKMLASQRQVVDLQEKFKVLSSEVEVSMIAGQISTLESQLTQERLRLEELLSNKNPSAARVDPLRNRIANLEQEIADARAKMTVGANGGASLAQIQSELLAAQADVQTRQLMLSAALESMEAARMEANRQTRYLSVGVSPVAPDEPTYPRAFENTATAFMILAGIYLMLSMTASILREQISA